MDISKLKDLTKDVSLNFIAVAISTGTMQLLLYPLVAKQLGSEAYGTMLTVMGVVNVVTLSFGNNLCNARIIRNQKYVNMNIKGDFQIFLLFFIAISSLIMGVASFFFKQSLILSIGIILATVTIIVRSYYLVDYRININYKKNLYANIALSVGFVIGSFFLLQFVEWPYVFVFSNIVCLSYIWYSSDIIKEPIKKTPLFRDSAYAVLMLILSGLIGNLTTYLDRFIIYPSLGGDGVSCYSTASYFTKGSTLIILPMTSVLLTYLSADKIAITIKRFNLINILIILFLVIYFFLSITFGKWITSLLFPTLIENASPYIAIASLGVLVGVGIAFCGTFVLAVAPTYWQPIISGVKFSLYLITCIILVRSNGIWGLCVGVIITNILCYLINYVIALYYLKRK